MCVCVPYMREYVCVCVCVFVCASMYLTMIWSVALDEGQSDEGGGHSRGCRSG